MVAMLLVSWGADSFPCLIMKSFKCSGCPFAGALLEEELSSRNESR